MLGEGGFDLCCLVLGYFLGLLLRIAFVLFRSKASWLRMICSIDQCSLYIH